MQSHMIIKILKFIFSVRVFHLLYNIIVLKKAGIGINKYPKINGRLYLKNKGIFIIGKNVLINSSKKINVIGGDVRTNILIGENAKFSMGDNVGISNSTFVCRNSITIENDVLFGGGCKIYDTDFHSINFIDRMNPFLNKAADKTIKTAPVIIKKGAWIGGHCIILKGITIGEKSIIGSGSVVTKNVPANEIWGGNPAKFIRKIE